MQLMAKVGDPSFNPSKDIARTSPFFADFDLFTPNDLDGQGQIPPYTTPSEIYPRCTYWPNLVTSFNPSKVIARASPFFADFDFFDPK